MFFCKTIRLPCILLVIGTIIYLRFGACEAVRFKFGYALLSYFCLNLDKRVSVINMNLIVRENGETSLLDVLGINQCSTKETFR